MIIMIRECSDISVLTVSSTAADTVVTVIEAGHSDSLVTLAEAVKLPTWVVGQHPKTRISMI